MDHPLHESQLFKINNYFNGLLKLKFFKAFSKDKSARKVKQK